MESTRDEGMAAPRVAVLMPTFRQAAFLPRAVRSLLSQTMPDWELVIVDDGSPDDTAAAIAPFLHDPRIRAVHRPDNRGLGSALNDALDASRAPLVAYLPSDDVIHRDHLASLIAAIEAAPGAVPAHAGVRHHYNR